MMYIVSYHDSVQSRVQNHGLVYFVCLYINMYVMWCTSTQDFINSARLINFSLIIFIIDEGLDGGSNNQFAF